MQKIMQQENRLVFQIEFYQDKIKVFYVQYIKT